MLGGSDGSFGQVVVRCLSSRLCIYCMALRTIKNWSLISFNKSGQLSRLQASFCDDNAMISEDLEA